MANDQLNCLEQTVAGASETDLRTKQSIEGVSTRLHAGCFTYKSVGEHVLSAMTHWPAAVKPFLAAFATIMVFIEASALFTGANPQRQWAYPLVLFAAFVCAVLAVIWKYFCTCPSGFEQYPSAIRRIAIMQPRLWEYQLALGLLEHDIRALDQQIAALRDGSAFIQASSMKVREYNAWLGERMTNYLRLVEATKQLCVFRFPMAVISTRKDPATPEGILSAVKTLTECYGSLLVLERAGRAVLPPKAFARIHSIHLNWGLPIQGGFWQMCQWLEHICSVDASNDVEFEFNLSFASPPGVEEFLQEYDELQQHPERWENDI